MFTVIDSWFAGASGLRRIEYRVVRDGEDGEDTDYCLEYRVNGGEWIEVEEGKEGHRVAKGLMVIVVREDLRKGLKERKLA